MLDVTDDELERKIADLLKEHVGIGYTLELGGVVNPDTLFLLTDGAAHVVLHAVRTHDATK